jgi:hypothetical protein
MKYSELKRLIREGIKSVLKEQDEETPTPDEVGNTPENVPPPAPSPATPTVKTINRFDAKQLIKATKGKFFTATFIKKDGTVRRMNARLGVKAYLKGGTLPYDPEPKGLIPVYDVQAKGYRMVNLNTLTDLKIGNDEYKVR